VLSPGPRRSSAADPDERQRIVVGRANYRCVTSLENGRTAGKSPHPQWPRRRTAMRVIPASPAPTPVRDPGRPGRLHNGPREAILKVGGHHYLIVVIVAVLLATASSAAGARRTSRRTGATTHHNRTRPPTAAPEKRLLGERISQVRLRPKRPSRAGSPGLYGSVNPPFEGPVTPEVTGSSPVAPAPQRTATRRIGSTSRRMTPSDPPLVTFCLPALAVCESASASLRLVDSGRAKRVQRTLPAELPFRRERDASRARTYFLSDRHNAPVGGADLEPGDHRT